MNQEPDQMFSYSPPPFQARHAYYVPLLCFFFCFDGCGSGDFDDFYNHITFVAVLVGPLTLMTCGLLVLSTLLNEVSMCTNSRSKDLWKHDGIFGLQERVFYVMFHS